MWLAIRPQEPLVLGDVRSGSQFLATKVYVPGRVIRGAWAIDLARRGHDSAAIAERVARVRVGNFFPAPAGAMEYALPLPMTALSCKRNGGFASSGRGLSHGVVDELLARLAYSLLKAAGAPPGLPFSLVCSRCGDRMEPFSGFYAVCRQEAGLSYRHFKPRFHAQTKVALSRSRRSAAEGMLYTVSALDPTTYDGYGDGLVFVGRVEGDEQARADMLEALARTPIGALHSRGYGKVQVCDARIALPPLRERLAHFNEELARLWEDLRRLADGARAGLPRPDGTYFTVDLLAPGIFREEGLPCLVPLLRIKGQTLRPLLWVTRPDMASGWSPAWGLPKPSALAARMGSVYVFHWQGDFEAVLPELQRLEEEGIGERRDEGFGECLVCHPFHLEVVER